MPLSTPTINQIGTNTTSTPHALAAELQRHSTWRLGLGLATTPLEILKKISSISAEQKEQSPTLASEKQYRLICMDLDETLISAKFNYNDEESTLLKDRFNQLTPAQKKNYQSDEFIKKEISKNRTATFRALYQNEHKILFQHLASEQSHYKLMINTHGSYSDENIKSILTKLYNAPQELVDNTYIISRKPDSLVCIDKATSINRYIQAEKKAGNIFYQHITPADVTLIDDNPYNRQQALTSGMTTIDPTNEDYPIQLADIMTSKEVD